MTTSFVFDEVVTFFNSRGYHAKAVEIGTNLLGGSLIASPTELIHVDVTLSLEGWQYFQKHKDKEYSLTDCISFVIMRDLGITTALTFDRHFEQAGYIRQP